MARMQLLQHREHHVQLARIGSPDVQRLKLLEILYVLGQLGDARVPEAQILEVQMVLRSVPSSKPVQPSRSSTFSRRTIDDLRNDFK